MTDIDLKRQRRQSLTATAVGNILEWFDWAVYAVFSTYISANLFSKENATSALLGTLAVFAVGFVMRPLGGYVFGRLADKKGRRWVMLVTMLMMAGGSLMIAIIPSYETIGAASSFLLLLARLIQGFAHGGEATATNVYLPEIAPKDKRALYSCMVAVAMGFGTLLAASFGGLLTRTLSPEMMNVWGWRIPFFFGALLALIVLWMRRNMMESSVHEEFKANAETYDPKWTKQQIVRRAVEVFVYQAGTTLPYYIWSSYAAVYAISQHGMDKSGAFFATMGATVVNLCLVPIAATVADKIGRKPPVLVYFIGTIALTFPMFSFITSDPMTLFVAQSVMMGLSACIGGTQPAMLSEQVPTRYRTLIMGTAMPLAVALMGGTAPYLNTWLVSQNLAWVFNVYTIVVCVCSTIVVLSWRETRGIDLHDVR